ncbi:secondary thiamine-phosphate synthase enzyme YjbQ [Telmatocola sphagniphila]|uniref:Secondary thiamine-phosphate synthase enzyme YjbQ n=1 Tax=Telmatocola sphagniphila TaxID=1123043 RepID=A0A8E6EWJ8_9BACT|nr:secondary thiamine-phosphate synthase enzyme YjbQ [Telmatocola sphagniphila]QVL30653.1 secondary thiamine-phosphate synthase enzyme YjbQ [Telmatocola sphagniphila]
MHTITLSTQTRFQFLEITSEIQRIVQEVRLVSGLVCVYTLHTTAAITINENADPDVVHDMKLWIQKTIPQLQTGFRHGEGNSDSHIMASLVGTSETIIVEKGQLVLGTWQGIYFCEFDGPRTRKVHIKCMAG